MKEIQKNKIETLAMNYWCVKRVKFWEMQAAIFCFPNKFQVLRH
jgi:hypothetical protein